MTEPIRPVRAPDRHAPEAMLAAYAAGSLPYPFAVLVAAHVSLCDECRARLEAHRTVGGLALERLAPAAVSAEARRRTLAALDEPSLGPNSGSNFGPDSGPDSGSTFGSSLGPDSGAEPEAPSARGAGLYPAPLAALTGPAGPRWRSLGFGAKQAILWSGAAGDLRLLSIPAGQAVPEHGHRGLELTLVLAGAFSDASGLFRAGDLEVADEGVEHTPHATPEAPCLCAAATDAPLRFRALLPRLLQPMFRI